MDMKNRDNHPGNVKYAKAPYNFVPLNEMVVKSESEKPPAGDRYHSDKLTGYIQYTLETITPLYVRDTLDGEQINQKQDGNTKDNENPDFFSPGGKIKIPGSSLRGMIRNLIEIVSWGKFHFSDKDRMLYFRAVAETKSSLGDIYKNLMIDKSNNYFPKIKAGILRRISSDKYVIYPSKIICNTQIYRINYNIETRKVEGSNLVLGEYEFRKIFFKPVAPEDHTHYRFERKKNQKVAYKLKYAKITEIRDSEMEGYVEGYLVSSGSFGKKKHMHWIINTPDNFNDFSEIKKEVIDNYKKDEAREERADLIEMLSSYPAGVPCFYITDDSGSVISFGFTGMFRLPYNSTIGNHIPANLQNENITDISEIIFGSNSQFASRVFFEDADLLPDQQKDVTIDTDIFLTLLSPKPTTYQHYLEQKKGLGNNNLKHWNDNVPISGYKRYWHRNIKDWKTEYQGKGSIKDFQQRLKPINSGIRFEGNIRFENLSIIELGALLFTLDLPENHYHKLGMGKPYGFGSVKIIPRLFLINHLERYQRLFTNNNWFRAEREEKMDMYKLEFGKYILESINEKEKVKSLWEVDRMRHLLVMLDWKPTERSDWPDKTRYMEIEHPINGNEFKERLVLKQPLDTIEL